MTGERYSDPYVRWNRMRFDPGVPLRVGPMIYVGTWRGWAMEADSKTTTNEDLREHEAAHDGNPTPLHVRARDVVRVERTSGRTRIVWLTHEHPSASPYVHSNGTDDRYVECSAEEHDAFIAALGAHE